MDLDVQETRCDLDGIMAKRSIDRGAEAEAAEAAETARRQYATGVLNRRIMSHVASLDRIFAEVMGESGTATFFCACGREVCGETVEVPIDVYEGVRQSPHKFVVARGHAMPIDDVVLREDGYDVVEIKPAYRDPNPPTLETGARGGFSFDRETPTFGGRSRGDDGPDARGGRDR